MTIVSWTAFYEGASDRSYFDILLPRVMQEIVRFDGLREITIPGEAVVPLGSRSRTVNAVANEICAGSGAYYIVFIHADRGGRNIRKSLDNRSLNYCAEANRICDWQLDRCITITPSHETEAWALSDPIAVLNALGYRGSALSLGLPNDARSAERLSDPKMVLENAVRTVRGRRASRGASQLLPAIARNQSIEALRLSQSFQDFEVRLRRALVSLGCINY